ncbi:MAG: PQQ-binding-like beta-propeller repeat protein [Acidobacteriota bacterium]
MSRIHLFKTTFLCVIGAGLAGLVAAAEWPQWRGPHRDGAVSSFAAPKVWPENPKQVWRTTVGEGHSSPLVSGDRVYLHTRQGENETVMCLELKTGKLLWQDRYPAEYTMNPAARSHGKGPKSTPILNQGRLYTLGISGILSCYEAATGRRFWQKSFGQRFKDTSPLYGTAMSPLIDQGVLVVHVGGHDQGALLALDAASGQEKWSWSGDGPGYASPVVLEVEGTRQIVTQTQQNIVGLSATDGRLLWKIPFTTEYVQNIVTPLVYRQWVIVSGLGKGVKALRIVRQENGWYAQEVWSNPDVSMYMNSPVLKEQLLFGLSHRNKGQFFCLDANTGKVLWTSPGRQGDNAAMLRAGDWLISLTNEAQLIVGKAGPDKFQVWKQYSIADSPTWAHPVLVGSQVLIKDLSTLTLWSF